MARVDAHCHLWQLARGDYAWLVDGPAALDSLRRDFQLADLEPLLDAAGIESVVLVQAAATEAETDFLLSIADESSRVVGVVGWVDVASEAAVQRLHAWAEHPAFRGIRPMLQDIEDTNWLLDQSHSAVWEACVELGLSLDALVQPRHLPMLERFCAAHPALQVIIDHAAKPAAALSGDQGAWSTWRDGMTLLAQHPGVCCKVSGLVTELPDPNPEEAVAALEHTLYDLINAFGCERLLWGSDWPVLTLVSDYPEWGRITDTLLQYLNDDEREAVLGGNASRVYRLEVTV